jgi:hypothetical protein
MLKEKSRPILYKKTSLYTPSRSKLSDGVRARIVDGTISCRPILGRHEIPLEIIQFETDFMLLFMTQLR